MGKKLTQTEFIERARVAHGQKYSYTKTKYINASTHVIITCPIHGDFLQNPDSHTRGVGCPRCAGKCVTTESFILRAREVHGQKYDYSKVVYKNAKTKVCIVCPEHGEFWQTPDGHLEGKGCRECGKLKYSKSRTKSTDKFILQASRVHNNKYDYSETEYKGARNKVCIICPKHGKFYQNAGSHLSGYGCPKCRLKHQLELFEKLQEIFPDEEILFEVGRSVITWIKRYRFDIYFSNLNIAIEYDGPQHFYPKSMYGLDAESLYLDTVSRDNKKNELCKQNNCLLLRVPYDYTESYFNKIVDKIIKHKQSWDSLIEKQVLQ